MEWEREGEKEGTDLGLRRCRGVRRGLDGGRNRILFLLLVSGCRKEEVCLGRRELGHVQTTTPAPEARIPAIIFMRSGGAW